MKELPNLQDFGASIIHLPDWVLPLCPFVEPPEEPGSDQAQSSSLGIHPGIPAGQTKPSLSALEKQLSRILRKSDGLR